VTRLDDALERLYASPLEEFLAVRKQLVVELRGEGLKEAAGEVAKAAKPTVTAWALDRVARQAPELLRAAVHAREVAATAQKDRDPERLRQSLRDSRACALVVVHAARDVLAVAGHPPNAVQVRRMTETLQAAIAEASPARESLLKGQLTRDVAVDDPFAGMEAGPARPSRHVEKATPEPMPVRATAREIARSKARVDAAQRKVQELDAAVLASRTKARNAETAALRAQEDAKRCRREVGKLEEQSRAARIELQEAKAAAKE
jgi:hypothetical protein